jgi:MFS family permease
MPAAATRPGDAGRWYLVGVLTVAYLLSFIDRSILSLLVGPIRADLGISDTQVSLLHGLAFALFYTLLGIPIATLADRGNRRNIIAAGIAFWSLATACCGLARDFWQLFLARIGVGIGEAALSPAAYSMITDSFPRDRLNRALSVYTLGAFAGMGLALVIGGAVIASVAGAESVSLPLLGAVRPWQFVFILVGLPGLAVAVWVLTLREPPRQRATGEPAGGLAALLPQLRAHPAAYAAHLLGFALLGIVLNALLAWTPTHLGRNFGFSPARAGLVLGSLIVVCCTAGILVGGWCADRWQQRGTADAPLRVGVISAAGCALFGALAPASDSLTTTLALYAPLLFFSTFAYGAAPAALQLMTPSPQRAVASALYLFFLNLIGMGLGPLLTALVTDRWFADDLAVGRSLALVTAVAAVAAGLLLARGCRPFRAALAARAPG